MPKPIYSYPSPKVGYFRPTWLDNDYLFPYRYWVYLPESNAYNSNVTGLKLDISLFLSFNNFYLTNNNKKDNHLNILSGIGGVRCLSASYTPPPNVQRNVPVFVSSNGYFYIPIDPTINHGAALIGNYGYKIYGFNLVRSQIDFTGYDNYQIVFDLIEVETTITQDHYKNNNNPPNINTDVKITTLAQLFLGDIIDNTYQKVYQSTIYFDIPQTIQDYEHDTSYLNTR